MKPNKAKQLVEGWKNVKLCDLTEKIGSGVTPRGGSEVYTGEGVMLVRSQNVHNDNMRFDDIAYITPEIDEGMKASRLKRGDILYNITGASIGRSAVFDYDFSANVNQHVCIIRLRNDSPWFINYWLRSVAADRELYSFQAGGNREGLNFQQLGSFTFSIPKKEEQDRIVKILRTWDEVIEKLGEVIALKREVKKGLMQKLLTGDLRLLGFKGEWSKIKIGLLCDISRGGSPRPIQDYMTDDAGGLNWLKIGDVPKGSRYIYRTSGKIKKGGLKKTTSVNDGDFILSNSMSFGRPYIMKTSACIHDGWLALKNISAEVNKNFLYYLLSSEIIQAEFRSISAGSGVLNLKKETVSEVSINLPPLKEQDEIAEFLTSSDNEIELLEKKLQLFLEQKKYLLNNLVTGKIRTPENL